MMFPFKTVSARRADARRGFVPPAKWRPSADQSGETSVDPTGVAGSSSSSDAARRTQARCAVSGRRAATTHAPAPAPADPALETAGGQSPAARPPPTDPAVEEMEAAAVAGADAGSA